MLKVPLKVVHEGLRPPIPSFCSEGFGQLIRDCWMDDPRERPDFFDIITRLSEEIEDMKARNVDSNKRYWGAAQFV